MCYLGYLAYVERGPDIFFESLKSIKSTWKNSRIQFSNKLIQLIPNFKYFLYNSSNIIPHSSHSSDVYRKAAIVSYNQTIYRNGFYKYYLFILVLSQNWIRTRRIELINCSNQIPGLAYWRVSGKTFSWPFSKLFKWIYILVKLKMNCSKASNLLLLMIRSRSLRIF